MLHSNASRKNMYFRLLLVSTSFWIAVAQGCSESESAGALADLPTYPVKGSVKLSDGKPLTTGLVVLALPEQGLEFSAPLAADGTFVVKGSHGDGAPEGEYRVRIESDPDEADSEPGVGKKAAPFPAKYGSESTSGLTVVIQPTDNTLAPFVLKK